MGKLKSQVLVLSIIFLAGCVLSLEPFYIEESVIEIPELNGKWQPADREGQPEESIEPYVFNNDEILTHDEGGPGLLHVTYFKIDGLIFADTKVKFSKSQSINLLQTYHLINGHMVSRIIIEGNRLIVIPLNVFWFSEYIEKNQFANRIDIDEGTILVNNVSSQEWVKFLRMYGTDKEAFPERNGLVYIRQIDE